MPNPQEIQLQRVCAQPETFRRGQEIMRLALVKTRPGSGYDLATGASGLPPICAYIASQELNNGDVTKKVAQSASCLNDKVFTRTLNVVRKATAADGKPNKSVAMTYTTLTRSYTIGMVSKVVAWMDEAERALVLKEVLPPKYDVNSPLVRCAIFFWVCKILKIAQVESAYLVEDYELSRRSFDAVIKILAKDCGSVANKITSDVAELRKAQRQKVHPASINKLKEDDDEDMSLPETPTKKRKVDPLPIKASGRPPASNAAMDVDQPSNYHHSPSPPPQPRRFRPIFLDRKQWLSRDPRIVREWPAMMEHRRNMVDLYGHPFMTQMPDFQMQDT